MEDFETKVIGDVTIEIVNLTRATYKEAGTFKDILKKDIERQIKKIVVDLSQCEFIDSTFIGVLVLALKDTIKINGKLRVVSPASITYSILEKTNTMRIFNVLDTLEDAKNSF
ncbi:MAG: STAS domain-containing protein [Ignavibacteriaceae bacterium]|jgi:anti-anti-sigma factor